MDTTKLSKKEQERYEKAIRWLIGGSYSTNRGLAIVALERKEELLSYALSHDLEPKKEIPENIREGLQDEYSYVEAVFDYRIEDVYMNVSHFPGAEGDFKDVLSEHPSAVKSIILPTRQEWDDLNDSMGRDKDSNLEVYAKAFGEEFAEICKKAILDILW